MSTQTTQNTEFFFDTPEAFRRELEERRQYADTIVADLNTVVNLFGKLTRKATEAAKSLRVNTFNTRDAA